MIISNVINNLEIIIKFIITKHLNDSYCVAVISDSYLNCDSITTSFIYLKPSALMNFEELLLSAAESGCSDYIVQVPDPIKFLDALAKVTREGLQRRGDKKLVFIPIEFSKPMELLSILNHKKTEYLPNLILIIPKYSGDTECDLYDVIAKRFVGPDSEVNQTVILDVWNSCTESFSKENVNLFPNDMSNVYGKIVKVSGFTYEPYVLLDIDPEIEPLGRDGIEIKVVEEFCRLINCSIEMVAVDDDEAWGELFDNGTGSGVIGKLIADEADFGITSIYSWFDSWKALDFSAAYIRTAVCCVAPAPRVLIGYDLPLMAFSSEMWITLIFALVFATFALMLAQRSSDKVLLTTFGMIITQSQSSAGETWRIRSITIWLLVTGLIIDNAYGSGLAAAFTVPKYEKSIDTIQDLLDLKMEWAACCPAWAYSVAMSNEPKIKSLVDQFRMYDNATLTRKSFTRDTAFPVEILPAGHLAIMDSLTKEAMRGLQLMTEDIYFEQCVMIARKSSPYIAKVNELVGRLHQSGLLLAWESQVALKYLDFEMQLEVKLPRSKRETEIKPFSIQHLVGAFIIYCFGLIVALLIFVIELVYFKYLKSYNYKNRRNILGNVKK